MAKRSNFSSPAQKYAGKVKIDEGPVWITRWLVPSKRADQKPAHDDLRPEMGYKVKTRPDK